MRLAQNHAVEHGRPNPNPKPGLLCESGESEEYVLLSDTALSSPSAARRFSDGDCCGAAGSTSGHGLTRALVDSARRRRASRISAQVGQIECEVLRRTSIALSAAAGGLDQLSPILTSPHHAHNGIIEPRSNSDQISEKSPRVASGSQRDLRPAAVSVDRLLFWANSCIRSPRLGDRPRRSIVASPWPRCLRTRPAPGRFPPT